MGTEYTIDLLCHYCESIILIVDCTVSAVNDKQIDTLKNTSTYISKKIGKIVIPLIVSSEDCLQKKQTSLVPIMDKNDCEYICDLILKGHIVQAKQFFSELVFRNPEAE
jgi:hypothetical protein